MINPEAFMQKVLSAAVDCPVRPAVEATVGDALVVYHPVAMNPVANGPTLEAVIGLFAVSSLSTSARTARENAYKILDVLAEMYEADKAVAGERLAGFDVQMLPIRQPNNTQTEDKRFTQYDATYRIIVR